MRDSELHQQLLLRHLDASLRPDEEEQVAELLRSDPEAREFLRELAEHAVMVAELERTEHSRRQELEARQATSEIARKPLANSPGSLIHFPYWHWGLAAGIVVLAAIFLFDSLPVTSEVVRVNEVSGANRFFGSAGNVSDRVEVGSVLRPGDIVETLEGHSWLQLVLSDSSEITLVGRSELRIIDANMTSGSFYHLREGNLWADVTGQLQKEPLVIQTLTAELEVEAAEFHLESGSFSTVLRVYEGEVGVTRLVDGETTRVTADHQVVISLNQKETLVVIRQPEPVNHWNCHLLRGPRAVTGNWLPRIDKNVPRLGAVPILIPRPGKEPQSLFLTSFSVSGSRSPSVLLETGSTIRIHGRTERAVPVRFGFTTQKIRGLYSGKFEIEIKAESLGPPGLTWKVDLPVSVFRPKHAKMASSAIGAELADIYICNVNEEAGLEINHVELLPKAVLTEHTKN